MLLPALTVSPPAQVTRLSVPVPPECAGWLEGGLAVVEGKGTVLDLNPALAGWLKRPRTELVGQPLGEILAACQESWPQAWEVLAASDETFQEARWELPATDQEPARWFKIELSGTTRLRVFRINSLLPSTPALQEQSCEHCLSTEPAHREMFFQCLRAGEQLEQLMRRWPGIVFSQRPDGSFYFVSPKVEELTGVSASEWARQPQRFWEVIHEADLSLVRQQLQKAAHAAEALTCTFRIRHTKTGKVAYIMEHRQAICTSRGLLLGYEGVWLDHTRQAMVEKRLNSAAWKETLSSVTMGLAHDFRNVLTGIVGLTEALQGQVESSHPAHEGLQLIRANAWEASQSVQRIFQLYHGKSGEQSYHDLNELTKEMVEMARKMLSRRISTQLSLAEGSLPVYLDGFEFRQAFLNLVVNARDAMPSGGQLTFTTRRCETLPHPAHLKGQLPRLPAVCLEVADTGVGIAPQNLEAIFDPFFTTKGLDKGSGLGLYNVLLFVEKYHGAVTVESTEGRGTAFRLWLPEADFTEAEQQAAAQTPHTLLLVGEAGPALDSTAYLLRQHGFQVTTALSPAAAQESWRTAHGCFEAVLLQSGAQFPQFFADIKSENTAVKTILQIIGCNPDEVNTSCLEGVDLVISLDTLSQEIAPKIRALLAAKG